MRVAIATDHGGFELKEQLLVWLREAGHQVEDLGAHELDTGDDYPDYAIPLARAVASGKVERGILVCGSGVGVCVTANKIGGVRAALAHDVFSARQGVEDDAMNVLCLGGRIVGAGLAWELVMAFLAAKFSGAERHQRRLDKVLALEKD